MWLTERLATALRAEEREAVLGDIEESGLTGWRAAAQIGGLVMRRQAALWREPGPWVALVGVAGAAGISISGLAKMLTLDVSLQTRTWWRYGVRYGTGLTAREDVAVLAAIALAVLMWAWMAGFVVRRLSGRAAWITCGLFVAEILAVGGVGPVAPALLGMRRARAGGWPRLAALACLALAGCVWWAKSLKSEGFSRWIGSGWQTRGPNGWDVLGLAMACWPAVYVLAMGGRRMTRKRAVTMAGSVLLAVSACAAEGMKTPLIAEKARVAAPDFALADGGGRTVKLSALRGKVVLVNFWATYCGGCKVEIPWFQEFADQWGGKGLRVVGLSLDEAGWKDVGPYVAKTGVRYPMLIADKAVLDRYEFDAMPATYLVDRNGRVAARYIGLVDRADIEAKIRTLLAP